MAIKKYLKFDSEKGYLEDRDDINYFASNQMRKVAFGKMLGDFDENGLYVIKQKIVEELIKMPKVVVEVVEDNDLIRSKVKADAFFHFILTVEDNKASFKLLEKLQYQSNRDFNAGAYSNINEYILDEVIVPDKDFDRNALYQKYNISVENDGDVLSIFDMDELSLALYFNIVEKLKLNYLTQNQLILKEKELEGIEADYFEEMLTVLSDFPDINQKVVDGVQNDLASKHSFVIISKPFFQHTVNEILDSYIQQFLGDLTPEQRVEFEARIRKVKASYYEKFKKLLPIEIKANAGVRFNPEQIIEENIIGGLAKSVTTKGYTSSDIRRIIVNDDELQLSINKIKEIVKDNEEICKRDNAKADDIVANRKNTAEFYKTLKAKNKVDMLKPDTNLIKAIGDGKVEKATVNEVKSDKTNAQTSAVNNAKGNVNKNVKGGGGKTAGGKTAGGKPGGAKSQAKAGKAPAGQKNTQAAGAQTGTQGTKVDTESLLRYGTGARTNQDGQQADNALLDDLVNSKTKLMRNVKGRMVTQENKTEIDDVLMH